MQFSIFKKLEPRFSGPFTIREVVAFQNYNLIDATGEEHSRSVPLHKLKIIKFKPAGDNVDEVKKVLGHRRSKSRREYLVQ